MLEKTNYWSKSVLACARQKNRNQKSRNNQNSFHWFGVGRFQQQIFTPGATLSRPRSVLNHYTLGNDQGARYSALVSALASGSFRNSCLSPSQTIFRPKR